MVLNFAEAADEIIKAGRKLATAGYAPATAGNYSMRLANDEIAITISGADKGDLTKEQIMRINKDGQSLDGSKPSAETLLHTLLYHLYPQVNAVLHTHSIACVVLTRLYPKEKFFALEGYELLKAFPGIMTHQHTIQLPIFDNAQDMEYLSAKVIEVLKDKPKTPAYLIRSHGLYGWGKTMKEAEQVVHAAEVLLSCELETLKVGKGRAL